MAARPYDVAVVGAGLIGLSTAMHIVERRPRLRVVVLEKDPRAASQQSGHNSGVIHSGIYYTPGSFKARFSVAGRASMLRFCEENGVPTRVPGKLIVATRESDTPRLRMLLDRGTANQVPGLERVGPERAREIEPHVRAVEALWVPGTAVVDFRRVAEAFAGRFTNAGGEIRLATEVVGLGTGAGLTRVETSSGGLETRTLVNCAGLHADIIARMHGVRTGLRIIPFRGEYYTLGEASRDRVRGLIYPVPNPELPFLGVHFTRTIYGEVEAGPNAVLATRREGYRKRDVSAREVAGMLSFPGFRRLMRREWKTGLGEINRSLRKSVFLGSLRELIPDLGADDLERGGSGVRAQAVTRDGSLVDDFRIERSGNAIHVLNAPSPGATSSVVIGHHIAGLVEETIDPG